MTNNPMRVDENLGQANQPVYEYVPAQELSFFDDLFHYLGLILYFTPCQTALRQMPHGCYQY